MSRTFLGTGHYLKSTPVVFAPAGSSITYSAWIFPTAFPIGSNRSPIISANNASSNGLFVINNNGALIVDTSVGKNTGSAQSVNSTIILNTWQWVTAVYNQSTGVSHLYVNGVEVSYNGLSNQVVSNATQSILFVGNTTTVGNSFLGSIDTVGIWNIALTTTQIIAAMAAGGTPNTATANLIGYWPLLGTTSPEPESPVNTFPLTVGSATQGPNSPGQTSGSFMWMGQEEVENSFKRKH